ncbi:MAG: hypothetical protein M1434_04600, partial [Chloroflexi bacterium]|nr:hypothetical protein [Chloroflexota bacterium]MCL5274013.1 hypothetical protein [Chloroflexota bacterium]
NVSLPQACVGLAADWRISYPCAPLSCPTPSIIFGGSLAPASECTLTLAELRKSDNMRSSKLNYSIKGAIHELT